MTASPTKTIEKLTEDERDFAHLDGHVKALRIIDALTAALAESLARLPEGMQHCTTRFVECPVGHGRLTATNWEDNGCRECAIVKSRAECERQAERADGWKAVAERDAKLLGEVNNRAYRAEAECERLRFMSNVAVAELARRGLKP